MKQYCWFKRALRTGPEEWSKVHQFPAGSFTALCGRAIPHLYRALLLGSLSARNWGLIEVTDAARTPAEPCRRCEGIAAKLA